MYYFPSLCLLSFTLLNWMYFSRLYLIYRGFVQLFKLRRSGYKNVCTQNAIPKKRESRSTPKICLQALTIPVNSNAIQHHSGCKDFGHKKCSVGQNNSRVQAALTFFFINAMKTTDH